MHAVTLFLKHIEGVPKILVPDNFRTAVVRTDRYEPAVNRVLEDMANHYGCFIQSARPPHPKDKALIRSIVQRWDG